MGRSTKFIGSEVRLRPPTRAWAVASIVLCLAFAGAGDARAQDVSPAIAIPSPAIHVSPAITIPSAASAIPNLSAFVTPRLNGSTAARYFAPSKGQDKSAGPARHPNHTKGCTVCGPAGTAGSPPSHPEARQGPRQGEPLPTSSGIPAPAGTTGAVFLSKTPGGDTLGGAPVGEGPPVPRVYAPVSYGSATSCLKANSDQSAASITGSRPEDSCITVCGHYPYPACH